MSLALATTIALAACSGLPSVSELKSRPESALHPAAARFLSHNEHGAESTIEGPIPAIVGDVYAINDDADAVFAFYDAELPKLGYVRADRDLFTTRTTIEEKVRVWRNGDIAARVAIYRSPDVQVQPPPSDMPGATLFEIALVAQAPYVPPSRS